ncbi:GNAT family N-acetyltransferase [Qipengyuania sp.]|uniref:GNAT family N-acetyltransferase n=1 Tax=Qipengyuania sp. TaxID=2004515 RepID=UPI003735A8D8
MDTIDHVMTVMDQAFDPHWREAWTRRQVEDSLALPGTYTIISDSVGEKPITPRDATGFVLARRVLDEEELLLIGVIPAMRNRGLGELLLRRFLQAARDNGSRRVFLEMRAENPAERLYRRCGFDPIGRRKGYYRTLGGDTIDAITFARDL